MVRCLALLRPIVAYPRSVIWEFALAHRTTYACTIDESLFLLWVEFCNWRKNQKYQCWIPKFTRGTLSKAVTMVARYPCLKAILTYCSLQLLLLLPQQQQQQFVLDISRQKPSTRASLLHGWRTRRS